MIVWAEVAFLSAVALIPLSFLYQLALWQRKEYRFDRVYQAFMHRELWTTRSWLLVVAAFFWGLAWLFWLQVPALYTNSLVWLSLAALALFHGLRLVERGVIRPKPTKRLLVTGTGAGLLIFVHLFATLIPDLLMSLQLVTLVFMTPLFVMVAALITTLPAQIRKRPIIARAREQRSRLTKLTTIGITGSFGKTSTKHYLHHLLTTAGHEARATRERRNALFPVAQDILSQLTDKTEYYVAELGAYTQGEIKALASVTQPSVGVLTAIGTQHLGLFGSKENIARAKWELIEALPKNGVAVLNADDATIVALAKTFSGKKWWYSMSDKADVWLSNIEVRLDSVSAEFHFGDTSRSITLPIIGRGKLHNALAAATAAAALGLSPDQIAAGLANVPKLPRTLELITKQSGQVILDDSYSANEAGVTVALQQLALADAEEKVVVLEPLLELGTETAAAHEHIGRELSRVASRVIVTRNQSVAALKKGLGKQANKLTLATSVKKAERLVAALPSNSAILIVGRIPQALHRALIAG